MNPEPVTQFRVCVPNLPGELAKLTHLLLKAKVNITGMMTESFGEVAHVRMLATPEKGVGSLLEDAGFDVMEVPVFLLDLSNKPGCLNKLAKDLAEEHVNILACYGTGVGDKARLVVAVDDLEKAGPIISNWAEEQAQARSRKHEVKH